MVGRSKGSPPQVRGKLTKVKQGISEQRITPAGAGKTFTSLLRHNRFEDHPRRCGENMYITMTALGFLGSPPQVRGKLPQFVILPEQVGITPAGAGKTQSSDVSTLSATDHPRRCGENRFLHSLSRMS